MAMGKSDFETAYEDYRALCEQRDQLEAENAKLRQALEEIASTHESSSLYNCECMVMTAKAALEK